MGHLTFEARNSSEINQSSGVSVRVSINNYESMVSNAEKRALRSGETDIVPRVSDLHAVLPSTSGKIEVEYVGEEKNEEELIERLLNRAILKTFDTRLDINSLPERHRVLQLRLGGGRSPMRCARKTTSKASRRYRVCKRRSWSLGDIDSPGFLASATELVLEGLHLHQKLNKEAAGGRITYGK